MFITKNDLEIIKLVVSYLAEDNNSEAKYIKDAFSKLIEKLEVKTIVKNNYNNNRNKEIRKMKKCNL